MADISSWVKTQAKEAVAQKTRFRGSAPFTSSPRGGISDEDDDEEEGDSFAELPMKPLRSAKAIEREKLRSAINNHQTHTRQRRVSRMVGRQVRNAMLAAEEDEGDFAEDGGATGEHSGAAEDAAAEETAAAASSSSSVAAVADPHFLAWRSPQAAPGDDSGVVADGLAALGSAQPLSAHRRASLPSKFSAPQALDWWIAKDIAVGASYMHVVRGLGHVVAVGIDNRVTVHYVEGDEETETHSYTEKQWRQFVATDSTQVAERVAWAAHRARVEYNFLKDEVEAQQHEALDEMSATWPEFHFTSRVTKRVLLKLEREYAQTPLIELERGRGFGMDSSGYVSPIERIALITAMQTVVLGFPLVCWSKRTGLMPSPFKRVYQELCEQMPTHRLTAAFAKKIFLEVRAAKGTRHIEKTTDLRSAVVHGGAEQLIARLTSVQATARKQMEYVARDLDPSSKVGSGDLPQKKRHVNDFNPEQLARVHVDKRGASDDGATGAAADAAMLAGDGAGSGGGGSAPASASSSSAAAGGPDFAAKPMTVLDSIKFDEEVQKKQQLAKEQNRQRALRKVGTPSPRTQPPGKTPGAPGTPGNCTPRAEQRRASRRKSNFADPLKTITAVQKPWYIRMHVNIGDEVMHSLHGRGKVVLIDVSDQRVHVQFGDQDGGKHRYTEESWKSKLRPADVVDARGSDAFVALDTFVTKRAGRAVLSKRDATNVEVAAGEPTEKHPCPLRFPFNVYAKQLLQMVAQRMLRRKPCRARSFRKAFQARLFSDASCCMLRDLFWWVWCREFQPDAEEFAATLRARVSVQYMGILGRFDGHRNAKKVFRQGSITSSRRQKDLFFQFYPYALANALSWAFHLLIPTMRIANLFDAAFKWRLYSDVHMLLTGVDAAPSTLRVVRESLFPDEDLRSDEEKAPMPGRLGHSPRKFVPGPGSVPLSLILHNHERVQHDAAEPPLNSPSRTASLSPKSSAQSPDVRVRQGETNSRASTARSPSKKEREHHLSMSRTMAAQRETLMQLPEIASASRAAPGRMTQLRQHRRQMKRALKGGSSPLARVYFRVDGGVV